MQRNATRRTCLRRIGATATVAALAAAPAAAAECDATIYTNATDGGEPKLEVPDSAEATVTGESTCDPGTELSVRANSTGGSSPFVRDEPATVSDGGGWSVTFDFSAVDPGQAFDLAVYHDDGTELASLENCEIVDDAPTPKPTPSPTPTATEPPTDTPTDTPTASPTATPAAATDEDTGSTATEGSAGTGTGAPDDGTPTSTSAGGGDPDAGGDSSPTSAEGPGFGVLAALGGLAAAAWRLRGRE